jgi:hypothetical protein
MTSSTFNSWLSDFFLSYYKNRPVNATFIGIHAYDHELPRLDRANLGNLTSEMEDLLERLERESPSQLSEYELLKSSSWPEGMDRLQAGNFLKIQLAELESKHFLSNPATYTGEAIFSVISLFLRDFAPLSERVKAAISRMNTIPDFLEQSKANLRAAPGEWTAKAIRECTGAILFLKNGISIMMNQLRITSPGLRSAAEHALSAFREYQIYLSKELALQDTASYASEAPFYDLLIQNGHCIGMNASEVAEYGLIRLSELQEEIRREARKISQDGDYSKILAQMDDHHPPIEGYLQTFQDCWSDCRRTTEEKRLLTWPDYPIHYKFIPVYFREAAPLLYFLPYRSPSAFDNIGIHEYLVTPIDSSMSSEQQERLLRASNYASIKLNHVVHHGGIGHHIQNHYAYHSASCIGQIAAVDCAYRIAMFSGGTMAEGWACYAVDLMSEANFYTKEERIARINSKIRQAARAVVDSKIHSGEFSFSDAVEFYTSQARMTPDAAHKEVVKDSMYPGTAAMYLLGSDMIHKMRRKLMERERTFDLMSFHNRLLSYGSIPVALIARTMFGEEIPLEANN